MEKEKKFRLNQLKIQSFTTDLSVLDQSDQELVKGGSGTEPVMTTQVPIFCSP